MDRLFLDFRRNPVAYLSSRNISSQDLVDELLQVRRVPHSLIIRVPHSLIICVLLPSTSYYFSVQLLMTASDKNDSAKLAALRVFQEAVSERTVQDHVLLFALTVSLPD